MNRGKIIDDQLRGKALGLRRQGLTHREIGTRLGIGVSTARRAAIDPNEPKRPALPPLSLRDEIVVTAQDGTGVAADVCADLMDLPQREYWYMVSVSRGPVDGWCASFALKTAEEARAFHAAVKQAAREGLFTAVPGRYTGQWEIHFRECPGLKDAKLCRAYVSEA